MAVVLSRRSVVLLEVGARWLLRPPGTDNEGGRRLPSRMVEPRSLHPTGHFGAFAATGDSGHFSHPPLRAVLV